ncbi:hypothetical protein ACU4GR_08415 (plasmid) [Methylobacterium oryzae CBMB20]
MVLLIGGSVWIMSNMNSNMMPPPSNPHSSQPAMPMTRPMRHRRAARVDRSPSAVHAPSEPSVPVTADLV